MCSGCWEEAGSPSIINDKVLAAANAVNALYEVHFAGGHMHIVTDDWNVEDDNLAFCRSQMDKEGHDELEMNCLVCFEALSEAERYSALAIERGLIPKPSTPA